MLLPNKSSHMVSGRWFAYKLLLNEIHTHFDGKSNCFSFVEWKAYLADAVKGKCDTCNVFFLFGISLSLSHFIRATTTTSTRFFVVLKTIFCPYLFERTLWTMHQRDILIQLSKINGWFLICRLGVALWSSSGIHSHCTHGCVLLHFFVSK